MKKTLSWCSATAAIMKVAAHLCRLRMYQPKATSSVMCRIDSCAAAGSGR